METPEARAKSAELHKKLLEEEKLKNPSAEGEEDEDEEGEVDENEDLSSGEEEIQVRCFVSNCRAFVAFEHALTFYSILLDAPPAGRR